LNCPDEQCRGADAEQQPEDEHANAQAEQDPDAGTGGNGNHHVRAGIGVHHDNAPLSSGNIPGDGPRPGTLAGGDPEGLVCGGCRGCCSAEGAILDVGGALEMGHFVPGDIAEVAVHSVGRPDSDEYRRTIVGRRLEADIGQITRPPVPGPRRKVHVARSQGIPGGFQIVGGAFQEAVRIPLGRMRPHQSATAHKRPDRHQPEYHCHHRGDNLAYLHNSLLIISPLPE
jgi:hypothetical protein